MTGRWRSDERGQTSVMAMVVLMAMVLLVAVVADVGQAVNRKIALQLVADAGAFTGASKMAEGMNYLAYGNAWMQSIYGYWTWAFVGTAIATVDDCEALDGVTDAFTGTFWGVRAPFEYYNYAYANLPYLEARRVSARNAAEMFPGEDKGFGFSELPLSDVGSEPGIIGPFVRPSATTLGTSRPFFKLASVDTVSDGTSPNVRYPASVPALFPAISEPIPCVHWDVPPVPGVTEPLQRWFEKKGDTSLFVWHVRAPPTKALFFDRLLGGGAIPAMRAVAAAKPTQGSMKDGDAVYVAKMVPVRQAMTVPAIFDSKLSGLSKLRPILH